ncbi:uncharacterized protein LOC122244161 [Penaeus japonicus]|uniref:uncharacterized protein LOC122244161 n=1 Tax=Penaeus japonicus TaxID=27405 RepID=UPI001C710C2E|nr:uncharacterized protein LOC122244161 [Penaeus japonicus]
MTRYVIFLSFVVCSEVCGSIPYRVERVQSSTEVCSCIKDGLNCDFSSKKVPASLLLDSPPDCPKNQVHIYNAPKVYIYSSVCTNIYLNNVGSVEFRGKMQDSLCPGRVVKLNNVAVDELNGSLTHLEAHYSNLSSIYLENVTELVMSSCHIESLTISKLSRNDSAMFIYDLKIHVLDLSNVKVKSDIKFPGTSKPDGNVFKIHISNSSVGTLSVLPLTNKFSLILENTSVDKSIGLNTGPDTGGYRKVLIENYIEEGDSNQEPVSPLKNKSCLQVPSFFKVILIATLIALCNLRYG